VLEAGVDVAGFEDTPDSAGHAQPGVVVDEVEDLDVAAVGQGPVGDVGLPAFVRLLSGEPDIAVLGTLVRLGDDEATGPQDPPDRRDCRRGVVAAFEVERDRRGAGLMSGTSEFLADLDDLVFEFDGRAIR
jgi:hypothetical protein